MKRFLPLLVLTLAGCASTGATLNSGVGDRILERAPWYAGIAPTDVRTRTPRIGHLPVAYQRGAAQSPIFDPAEGEGSRALLAAMTAWLDSAGITTRIVQGTPAPTGTPPNVTFGCITSTGTPDGDCAEEGDATLAGGQPRMKLAVGRPSQEWIAWNAGLQQQAGVDATLVITLEVGQYLVRQAGITGRKEVDLGTGNTVHLPWLTSLDTPVSVLQITGAVIGADGKALRIGAEGLLARRTSLLVSAVGGQRVISRQDMDSVRTTRRTDLPGAPFIWEAGLRELVGSLVTR